MWNGFELRLKLVSALKCQSGTPPPTFLFLHMDAWALGL
eukprot:CAMPEP_0174923260 /NCGR_PEP_ID=MMETSP1355-20121228/6464_1 /TAXON_ID=464990 /ORGANISM="Hemiselmis tepida, Strain CCMP443" /LENGTH=38 /DNA_ID= /DNA_START= /DNA_END= /DNA_ORIENTATION=